jgi:hypothetical protein
MEFAEPIDKKIETFKWRCPIEGCVFLIIAYSAEGRNTRMTMHMDSHKRRMTKNPNELELTDEDRKFLAIGRVRV